MLHSSRIVLTGDAAQPYAVILHRGPEGSDVSTHPVATMREGEALIRSLQPEAAVVPDREYHPA